MIENLEKHISTKFTTDEKLIDEIFRSPFFEDLEEINEGVFEVRQRKKTSDNNTPLSMRNCCLPTRETENA